MAVPAFGQKSLCLLAVILSASATSGSTLGTMVPARSAGLGMAAEAAAAAAAVPASSLSTSFIPSFAMSIQGFGQASLFTFQQPLPHRTLPYAVQDEWVQYAYPDGSAAVYNVALMNPVNGVLGLGNRRHAAAAASQPYVAVKAGDIAQLADWFYTHGSTDSTTAEEPGNDEQLLFHEQKDVIQVQQHAQDHKSSNMMVGNAPSDDLPAQSLTTAAQPVAATCAYRTFQLYLGMSIPLISGGGLVSKQQLEAFLQAEVSPRVQGFTVLSGSGFWAGESEPVAVLEVVGSEAGVAEAVMEIAVVYKQLFGQEAVLLKEAACPAAVQLV